MKKLIPLGFCLAVVTTPSFAAISSWSDFTSWFKRSAPPQQPAKTAPADEQPKSTPAASPTAEPGTPTEQPTSAAPVQSNPTEGVIPTQPPSKPAAGNSAETSLPRWNSTDFPEVAIAQKNYPNIDLKDYVTVAHTQDTLFYSLTPDKTNPAWVTLQPGGKLHIKAEKISPEDVNTTQIISLTATNARTGQSSSAEIAIKITPNAHLTAPQWMPGFDLHDAVPNRPYFVNLASAINLNQLLDADQLTFELVNSTANWLQIDDKGFSLVAKKVPEDAFNKSYEVTLRVTSKMSGKSNDFTGRIYVNPLPQPLQWQSTLPTAVLNKTYSLDLQSLVHSNIKNDRFTFQVDVLTLPHWLSLQNNRELTGIPQDAQLLDQPQTVSVTATSQVTGLTRHTNLVISVQADSHLAPQWKTDFLLPPIAGEMFRSDDLTTALDNLYANDAIHFEYVSGPNWLALNNYCHCLASIGNVPDNAAGQSITIKLRAHSKASGRTIEYLQSVMVYNGVPKWKKTTLPDVTIAKDSEATEIPLKEYVEDDISGDSFQYSLDRFHSPKWIQVTEKEGQSYLTVHSSDISANEAGTVQTVRLLATSQQTHKSSAQLLTINVKPNPNLPKPSWKQTPPSIVTVGTAHVMDLSQYIEGSVPNDRVTIQLGAGSPAWLSIHNNRLSGIAPRDQIGGPYPVNLVIHSRASGTETTLSYHISVQLVIVAGDTMETHSFYDNHTSIVIRGLKKNHQYHLVEVKGTRFDYGLFYSPHVIKTAEDWDNNPFYAIKQDKVIETGADGTVSIVYYTLPTSPAPHFTSVIIK
jgi:hypothetical protein